MEQIRILIIRHGETAWNAEKRLQGQTDITLDTAGLAQAEAAARWLSGQPVAAVYSSDLQRAQQTAACIAVALGLSPVLLPAMRERRYGLFEGLTYTEARSRHPALYHSFEMREPDFALPEGGERLIGTHVGCITHPINLQDLRTKLRRTSVRSPHLEVGDHFNLGVGVAQRGVEPRANDKD